jgi:hypothetical protein
MTRTASAGSAQSFFMWDTTSMSAHHVAAATAFCLMKAHLRLVDKTKV